MGFLIRQMIERVARPLNNMHGACILMHMRTTLIIDEDLLQRARELTGIKEKTALIHAGLEALIAREAAKRLASLGGTEPKLREIPRRRPA
jgi:Arc/MetJ family transcription regulator